MDRRSFFGRLAGAAAVNVPGAAEKDKASIDPATLEAARLGRLGQIREAMQDYVKAEESLYQVGGADSPKYACHESDAPADFIEQSTRNALTARNNVRKRWLGVIEDYAEHHPESPLTVECLIEGGDSRQREAMLFYLQDWTGQDIQATSTISGIANWLKNSAGQEGELVINAQLCDQFAEVRRKLAQQAVDSGLYPNLMNADEYAQAVIRRLYDDNVQSHRPVIEQQQIIQGVLKNLREGGGALVKKNIQLDAQRQHTRKQTRESETTQWVQQQQRNSSDNKHNPWQISDGDSVLLDLSYERDQALRYMRVINDMFKAASEYSRVPQLQEPQLEAKETSPPEASYSNVSLRTYGDDGAHEEWMGFSQHMTVYSVKLSSAQMKALEAYAAENPNIAKTLQFSDFTTGFAARGR